MCVLCTCLRWKKRFWASGCNWRHVLEIESKILRTHVFSQCRIGNEKWRNYNQTNFRVHHHSIWTNCTRNVSEQDQDWASTTKSACKSLSSSIDEAKPIGQNCWGKNGWQGGRANLRMLCYGALSPWRYMLRWLAPKRRLLQWPLGQASSVEICISSLLLLLGQQ